MTVFVATARNAFIAQLLFVISTCATKASILLFYRRMAKDTYDPRWRYAIWAALGFTAAYFVVVLVTYLLICQPLDAYWLSYDLHYDKPYTCLNGDIFSKWNEDSRRQYVADCPQVPSLAGSPSSAMCMLPCYHG